MFGEIVNIAFAIHSFSGKKNKILKFVIKITNISGEPKFNAQIIDGITHHTHQFRETVYRFL